MVSHYVQRARGPHDLCVGVPRNQLSRRDLAQRSSGRRQQADRRHAQRARTRRIAVDQPRRVEHTGSQDHPGAGAAGHQRRRAGRQLVRLDQLEVSGLPRRWEESGQRQFLCGRSKCRNMETGLPEGLRCGGDRPFGGELRTSAAPYRLRTADDLSEPAQLLRPSRSAAFCGPQSARNGKPGIQIEQPVTLAARRATRDQLHPRRIRRSWPSRTPTSGGPTRWASPTSTTCAWSSGSTTARPTPANCGSAFAPFLSTATRRAIPRARQGRQFLSDGQRQGLPGARRGIRTRPAVRQRPRPRRRRSALRQAISA